MIVNSNPITATLPTSGRTLANRTAIRIDTNDIITPIGILKIGLLIIFINLLGSRGFAFGFSTILNAKYSKPKSDKIAIIVLSIIFFFLF
jgi:hypothetical protein